MKKTILVPIFLLIFLVVAFLLKGQKNELSALAPTSATMTANPATNPAAGFSVQQTSIGSSPIAGAAQPASTNNANAAIAANKTNANDTQSEIGGPLTPQEKGSVHTMASTLFKFALTKTSPKFLIKELEAQGLKPVLGQDRNAYTGAMVTVRTEEALPGTRYAHAQYFQDGDKEPILQHYSIEIKPGPDSYETAHAELLQLSAQYAGNKYKLTKIDENMEQVELPHGYVAHIKKLNADDLRDNPINAHDLKADVGTVRMAIELNPHSHEETDSHLGH